MGDFQQERALIKNRVRRRGIYLLPNLFTTAALFAGFYAIVQAMNGRFDQSAIAIFVAMVLDSLDGRVARLTKTQSDLGLQLDSLADVISFGVAPALLVYRWGLTHFGKWGIFIAFVFCAAGALRLARFNVLAMKHDAAKPGKFIIGLPVPAASAVLVSLVLLNHQLAGSFVDVGQPALAILVVILSYLMVSRVRFRSFKDLRLSRRTITGFLAIAAFTAVVLIGRMHAALIFVGLMATYVGLGLTEEVFFYRRRREEERAAKATQPVVLEAEGGAKTDEEVLEELGAYDNEAEEDACTPTSSATTKPA
ncbi:MAG: CDP-diacylglycerol--serine O-phosphatidyltransferase [Polyangia bacterium]